MSLPTNWGYIIAEEESGDEPFAMDPLLSVEDFNDFTADKYAGDERIEPNIKAASSAIRNYCGWHIYPSYQCEFETYLYDRAVTRVGGGLLIQLPAKYISFIEAIEIGDTEFTSDSDDTHFVITRNGIIRVFGLNLSGLRQYTPIKVYYTAGIPDSLMDGLKELVAHRVTHALASSGGIQSETAGGVSITYSANWTNTARSTALADDNKEVLEPYRLQGVF